MQVVIVADTEQQRAALCDTIYKLGLMADCLSVDELPSFALPKGALWLVDSERFAAQAQAKIFASAPRSVLLGFEAAPYLSDAQAYDRWQRQLMRRLCSVLRIPAPKIRAPVASEGYARVLFLGASMGGPEALKVFLDNLSPKLPLAVLIAQHFDAAMMGVLPKILTRNNAWRCKIINTSQRLQAGLCLLAPIHRQIVCTSKGRVIVKNAPWQGEYRPNIGALLKNASEVFGSDLIAVIFSGMGSDGSQHAKAAWANKSLLWAQDPATCQSASQPKAFIDTGVCQFVASPQHLARRLNCLMAPLRA